MIKTKKHKETVKMKKIFYLKSCSINQRILKELNLEGVDLQNIKEENVDEQTLDFLKSKMGSYEALFSRKAMKFRSMGLNEMNLTEADYKKYMLEEYTFLKRPFMINEDAGSIWFGLVQDISSKSGDSSQTGPFVSLTSSMFHF